MRKFLAGFLAAVMMLVMLPATAFAAEKSNDLVILYTNDVHTYIDKDLSYDIIAGIKAELEEQYNTVLLLDAGDHIQGTAFGSMDKGKTIIDLMNAAGYDLATLGNHEFDYGMDGCENAVNWASFPYISANFYHEASGVKGATVLDAYVTMDWNGKKVAFVGITTPETFTKSTPAYFQDGSGNYIYGISGGNDGAALYADVQKAIDDADADITIAVGHLGDDPASKPWTSEETIANVSGLNAFIDGHSHSTVEGKKVTGKDGNEVLLTQTGEYFDSIGMMVIDAETGEIKTDLIGFKEGEVVSDLYSGEKTVADLSVPAVKAIKDAWIDSVNTQLGQVIGEFAIDFDNYDAEGNRLVRKQSTNTGSFAADALYFLFDDMDLDVDVAVMNGGGVRNKKIAAGDVSFLTAKDIHTFGNVACLMTVTGQQLLDALEWGAQNVGIGGESGGFLHTSGVRYDIDSSVVSSVQMDDKDVWTGGPTGQYAVVNVEVYNKETKQYEALDLNAKYNLAGYNYTLRDLGDGFNMFDGAVVVVDYVMEDYMVLANYIQGFENGVVDATNSPLNTKYVGFGVDYSKVSDDTRIYIADSHEIYDVDDLLAAYPEGEEKTELTNAVASAEAEANKVLAKANKQVKDDRVQTFIMLAENDLLKADANGNYVFRIALNELSEELKKANEKATFYAAYTYLTDTEGKDVEDPAKAVYSLGKVEKTEDELIITVSAKGFNGGAFLMVNYADKVESVNTGDYTSITSVAIASVVALGAMVVLKKKEQ